MATWNLGMLVFAGILLFAGAALIFVCIFTLAISYLTKRSQDASEEEQIAGPGIDLDTLSGSVHGDREFPIRPSPIHVWDPRADLGDTSAPSLQRSRFYNGRRAPYKPRTAKALNAQGRYEWA
ncbi:hypothetical protein F4805DRAFT_457980 [Annulohypoxylon moriforme]|nr:hypothetical protein F4805DRAFT_457980 [Annulohypoxylon moriforme]